MASKDLTHKILAKTAFAHANVTDDANGTAIDTQGFESVAIVGNIGASAASTDIALSIEDSDDGSTFAAAEAADQYDEVVEIGASEAARPFQLGYRGPKRYVRLVATHTAGSATVNAVAVLANPRETPTY